jgi:hypothetical protein
MILLARFRGQQPHNFMEVSQILYFVKSSPSLAGVISAGIGFATIELNTSNTPAALAVAALSAAAGAFFASWPKVILARKDARLAEGELEAKHSASLLVQQQEIYRHELDIHRERNHVMNRERVLMRLSKHNLLDECHRMLLWMHETEFQLREHKIDFQPFISRPISELLKDEDREMYVLTEPIPSESK